MQKNSQITEITELRYSVTDDLGKRSSYKKAIAEVVRE